MCRSLFDNSFTFSILAFSLSSALGAVQATSTASEAHNLPKEVKSQIQTIQTMIEHLTTYT